MPEPKVPFEYFVRGALKNIVDGQNELLETVSRHSVELRGLRLDVDQIKHRRSDPPRPGWAHPSASGLHMICDANEFERLQREWEGKRVLSMWNRLKDSGWAAFVKVMAAAALLLLGYVFSLLTAHR